MNQNVPRVSMLMVRSILAARADEITPEDFVVSPEWFKLVAQLGIPVELYANGKIRRREILGILDGLQNPLASSQAKDDKPLTVRAAAEAWRVDESMVRRYCGNEAIPGAKKIDGEWRIPADAKRPKIKRPSKSEKPTKIKYDCIHCDESDIRNKSTVPPKCKKCGKPMQRSRL